MLPPCHEKFHKSVGLKKFMSIFLLFSIIVLVLLPRNLSKSLQTFMRYSSDHFPQKSLKISPTQLGKSNFEILSMIFLTFKQLCACFKLGLSKMGCNSIYLIVREMFSPCIAQGVLKLFFSELRTADYTFIKR